jgi:TetR/AcrR family transcriptional regulator
MSFVIGRWHQFAKSGFKRDPTQYWDEQWRLLLAPESPRQHTEAA